MMMNKTLFLVVALAGLASRALAFNYCCKEDCTMDRFNTPGQCFPLSVVEDIAEGITGNFKDEESCNAAEGNVVDDVPFPPLYCADIGSCCVLDDCANSATNGGEFCLPVGTPLDAAMACDFIGLQKCTFCEEGAGCSMDPHFVTWPNVKNGGERTKFDCKDICLCFAWFCFTCFPTVTNASSLPPHHIRLRPHFPQSTVSAT